MGDVVFVAIVTAFFAVAVLYVRACGALLGADAAEPPAGVEDEADEAVAA